MPITGARRLAPLLASGALCLACCSTPSGFIQVKNPFEGDSRKSSGLFHKLASGEKSNRSAGDREEQAASPARSGKPAPYFGKGRGPAPDLTRTELVARQEPSDAPVARRGPPGTPCYPCNGKGHLMDSLERDGDLITCETCQGSGRN